MDFECYRLLARVDGKLCYTLTPYGRRVALFLTKLYARVLRPGFQALDERIASKLRRPSAQPSPRWMRLRSGCSRRRDLLPKNSDTFMQTMTLQDS